MPKRKPRRPTLEELREENRRDMEKMEEGEQTTLQFRDEKSIFINGQEYIATLQDGVYQVDWIEEGEELEVIDILKEYPQPSPPVGSPLILQTQKVFKKVKMHPLTDFKKVAG